MCMRSAFQQRDRDRFGRAMKRTYKTALVTGASRGIGAAFARNLTRETELILCARSEEHLVQTAEELLADGRSVQTVPADLTDNADREKIVALARERRVDLLINNAGAGRFGSFLDVSLDAHKNTIDLNISAPVSLARAILPSMLSEAFQQNSRAGLINVSSSTAFAPIPRFAVYSASKAFILSWTEALSAELSDEPIDILAFCPGAVGTNFGEAAGYRRGRVPGAMKPDTAAMAALSALGRTETLVLDQFGTVPLSAAALGRSALARLLKFGIDRFA